MVPVRQRGGAEAGCAADGAPAAGVACGVLTGRAVGGVGGVGRECKGVGGPHGEVRRDAAGPRGCGVSLGVECGWADAG